jgi:predicted nucleotidyltransferase
MLKTSVNSRTIFDELLTVLQTACDKHYGNRLISLAVFGSVGRGVMRPDSDIDLLIVAAPLPAGRIARVQDFAPARNELETKIISARTRGVQTRCSPIFKTPAEIIAHSPIILDMTEDARILYDRDGFLNNQLAGLRARLKALGARRIWKGEFWWWDLKPNYKQGEVFAI